MLQVEYPIIWFLSFNSQSHIKAMEVNSGETTEFVENLIVNSVRSFDIEHKIFVFEWQYNYKT